MHETYRGIARGLAGAGGASVLVAFLLSGCAYSLGDFGWNRDKQPEMSAAALPPQPTPQPLQSAATTQAPLQASALADDGATTGSIGPSNTGTFVAPGVPQDQPASRLLTPEEKARAVAELEALARGQQVGQPAGAAKPAVCAEETLDPAERLKLEQQGITC